MVRPHAVFRKPPPIGRLFAYTTFSVASHPFWTCISYCCTNNVHIMDWVKPKSLLLANLPACCSAFLTAIGKQPSLCSLGPQFLLHKLDWVQYLALPDAPSHLTLRSTTAVMLDNCTPSRLCHFALNCGHLQLKLYSDL